MAKDDPQGTEPTAAGSRRDRLADPFASGKKARPKPPPPPPLPGHGAAPPPEPKRAPEPEEAVEPVETAEPGPEVVVEPVGPAESAPGGSDDDAELVVDDPDGPDAVPLEPEPQLSDDDLQLLADAERGLVAEYRDRAARAEAELANFRMRVERDRQANREAVVAEVIRSLLPAIDDLDRAEAHGDLEEGSPLALVAQKLRTAIERHGLTRVGEVGEAFDPTHHEALVTRQSAEVGVETVAHVIEPGYLLGERVIRPAKVAVDVPE